MSTDLRDSISLWVFAIVAFALAVLVHYLEPIPQPLRDIGQGLLFLTSLVRLGSWLWRRFRTRHDRKAAEPSTSV